MGTEVYNLTFDKDIVTILDYIVRM